jgi:hypothetical protein
MISNNNNKKQSNEDGDMNSLAQLIQDDDKSNDDFSDVVDTNYLRSAILWRKAVNKTKEQQRSSTHSTDELAEARAWKAFQERKSEDNKKKATLLTFKQPYLFATAASIMAVVIAYPIYQQYSEKTSYQSENQTKSFIVYDPHTVENPLQVGTQLKEDLEKRGLTVALYNDDNIISLDISAKQKPTKNIINYLQSKNIVLDSNNKAYIQFLSPAN